MTVDENTIDDSPEAPITAPDAPETEEATFDAAYVKSLRSEAAARRREAKEGQERLTALEGELSELRAWRLDAAIREANVGVMALADPADLLTFGDRAALVDDDGKPDPVRIEAAIAALIERKPHLRRPWGSVNQGVQPMPTIQERETLGGIIGRAARGQRNDEGRGQ